MIKAALVVVVGASDVRGLAVEADAFDGAPFAGAAVTVIILGVEDAGGEHTEGLAISGDVEIGHGFSSRPGVIEGAVLWVCLSELAIAMAVQSRQAACSRSVKNSGRGIIKRRSQNLHLTTILLIYPPVLVPRQMQNRRHDPLAKARYQCPAHPALAQRVRRARGRG